MRRRGRQAHDAGAWSRRKPKTKQRAGATLACYTFPIFLSHLSDVKYRRNTDQYKLLFSKKSYYNQSFNRYGQLQHILHILVSIQKSKRSERLTKTTSAPMCCIFSELEIFKLKYSCFFVTRCQKYFIIVYFWYICFSLCEPWYCAQFKKG